ncbi:MAG: BREX-1 system phosphatase PglZ type A [Deltaproteobacteria bacterium]|jgi:uncharacterized protein (TIGR02687 family)|nr:BREX-1 system phosphatase PglZ type A [Deltaproteobacteria bacterium]
MENRIVKGLEKLFSIYRIVFWYDAKKEFRSAFEKLSLPDVEKLEIRNNEYYIKYTVLRSKPDQKFLLYKEGNKPEDLDNWLLDVLLSQCEFRADQMSMWLSDLSLGEWFRDEAVKYKNFFSDSRLREKLKKLLKKDDELTLILLKMLAVCVDSDIHVEAVVEKLLEEAAESQEKKYKLIESCGLIDFFWGQISSSYGYKCLEPTIKDFAIELFKSCYHMETDGEVKLNSDALVFFKRLKDSSRFKQSFETLSEESAQVLGIEDELKDKDFRELKALDHFELIDKKIISSLAKELTLRTLSTYEISTYLVYRRQSFWYEKYKYIYEALDYGSQLFANLNEIKLTIDILSDGVDKYANNWYKLDNLYRKFIYAKRKATQATLLGEMSEQIENFYVNNFLLKLGNLFQEALEKERVLKTVHAKKQSNFYETFVKPFLQKKGKICVIISDGLRYEIGHDLMSLIRQEDRYNAELKPALSMLPSYTQLGMAALLPNNALSIAENERGEVFSDGQSTLGIKNREKILQASRDYKSIAIMAQELMDKKQDDCRSLVRDNDLIYVYHDLIDQTGDKRGSEDRVFEAVEETLDYLLKLVKKLASANVTNFLITADHGFLYQNRPIDDSFFLSNEISGDKIFYQHRRFVLGKGLKETADMHKFSSQELGLVGDIEALIPKSIYRIRKVGSISRYVHGGATLQEVMIPIIVVNKKRSEQRQTVDVTIILGERSIITTGQLTVTMFQNQPVTDKMKSRSLQAGIYAQDGSLISELKNLNFDFTSENPRERELRVSFVLTRDSDKANNQEVTLRLMENHPGTTHYILYTQQTYTLRRSFTTDFDF